MFDIGFSELFLIVVVALLVVGPERLPGLIRTAGQWVGRAQRIARDLRTELERDTGVREIRQFQDTLGATNLEKLAEPVATPASAPPLAGTPPDQERV